jgi:hypothetical protein
MFKVINQVPNWDNERAEERLVETLEYVIVNRAQHPWLIQLFYW